MQVLLHGNKSVQIGKPAELCFTSINEQQIVFGKSVKVLMHPAKKNEIMKSNEDHLPPVGSFLKHP